ncbi:hypothetical protein [uncultured Alsobacter sp.]|uniref:hypothetical protein n=1 Tax=uncultured Alsobacter sp. TaxID=1748258 RepID=UPI0025F88BAC|nr:hypothetical protein [uncultured Alsobacter sp.]
MISLRTATALSAAAFLLAMPAPSMAQGVVRGAQEGAAVGNKAAGPVGGVVGGAVGGIFGGVAGGVKGVLGIPQNTSTGGRKATRAARSAELSRNAIRSELLGRPLTWRSEDGSQTGTTVFYTDNTAALMNSNIANTPDDKGKWTMRNNWLCITWDKINPGTESCSTWTRTGPKTYRDSGGITFTAS